MPSKLIEDIKNPDGDEDRDLVRGSQEGDLRAFEALVDRHQKRMINLAYRMTGDYEEACDLVQEAFLSAYRSLGKFRGEARFSTWLYAIVVNKTRNRLRSIKGRGRIRTVPLDSLGDPEAGSAAVDPPSPEASALERLERKEIEARVQECIEGLETDFREPLVLRDIMGYAYEEIVSLLRIPDGTVKSRLFRARAMMKDCLKKGLGDL